MVLGVKFDLRLKFNQHTENVEWKLSYKPGTSYEETVSLIQSYVLRNYLHLLKRTQNVSLRTRKPAGLPNWESQYTQTKLPPLYQSHSETRERRPYLKTKTESTNCHYLPIVATLHKNEEIRFFIITATIESYPDIKGTPTLKVNPSDINSNEHY